MIDFVLRNPRSDSRQVVLIPKDYILYRVLMFRAEQVCSRHKFLYAIFLYPEANEIMIKFRADDFEMNTCRQPRLGKGCYPGIS